MKPMQETNKVPQPNTNKSQTVWRLAIGGAVAVVLLVGWYLFRPELLFVNQQVNEGFPSASALKADKQPATRELAMGMFNSVAHETKGTATIHEIDGERVLRLTDFSTSNGPDVHIYLVAANDAKDSETVNSAGFVDLGSLKGNQGDQNYKIPANADLKKYRAATIWCARFGVNFGTAPLMSDDASGTAATTAAASQPMELRSGLFHQGAHETSGKAAIYEVDGKHVLRLTNFKTSNGPDVHVYLVAAEDVSENDTVKQAGFVDLGSLKGNVGDQNYEIPSNVDLAKYRSATIWCARFGVNFGSAPLAVK